MYSSGGFSFNKLNREKPVHVSDKSLGPSMFQSSSVRLACITSKVVWVTLMTSIYLSGIGNDSSLGV